MMMAMEEDYFASKQDLSTKSKNTVFQHSLTTLFGFGRKALLRCKVVFTASIHNNFLWYHALPPSHVPDTCPSSIKPRRTSTLWLLLSKQPHGKCRKTVRPTAASVPSSQIPGAQRHAPHRASSSATPRLQQLLPSPGPCHHHEVDDSCRFMSLEGYASICRRYHFK